MNASIYPIERTTLAGGELLECVRRQIDVGNVRRIAIQTERHHTLIEFPQLLGAADEVIAPVCAAVTSLGGILSRCSVVVERERAWPTGERRFARP